MWSFLGASSPPRRRAKGVRANKGASRGEGSSRSQANRRQPGSQRWGRISNGVMEAKTGCVTHGSRRRSSRDGRLSRPASPGCKTRWWSSIQRIDSLGTFWSSKLLSAVRRSGWCHLALALMLSHVGMGAFRQHGQIEKLYEVHVSRMLSTAGKLFPRRVPNLPRWSRCSRRAMLLGRLTIALTAATSGISGHRL